MVQSNKKPFNLWQLVTKPQSAEQSLTFVLISVVCSMSHLENVAKKETSSTKRVLNVSILLDFHDDFLPDPLIWL